MSEYKIYELITGRLSLPKTSVINAIKLLDDGATIPFIARYRKELTNSLDEVQIADIQKNWQSLNDLVKRKKYVIDTIFEQGKLTAELKSKIENCWDENLIEDIYLPFKKKRKTRADMAKEKGLEPLANLIIKQTDPISNRAKEFLSDNVPTIEEALQGARDIIAEMINENMEARELLRNVFNKSGAWQSSVVKKKESEASKYKDYFDYNERINLAPAHRVLAILRAEKEGFLKVNIAIDAEEALFKLKRHFEIRNPHPQCKEQIHLSIEDALQRLLLPSLETEFRSTYKAKADTEAIAVFSENLKQLLLTSPLGSKNIMGIDPGFRTGCKLVCLDKQGDLLHTCTLYPHPPQNQWSEAQQKIKSLALEYGTEAIAIGNGTAGKESFALVNSIQFEDKVEVYLVNENGASIYSASEIARNELPDHDITVRGAVSIGRRLMDPLSELVKIDPKSIGVGQYQHDVNQSQLKEKLTQCVEHCVNAVGVDVNTASEHLLSYISGLGPVLAKNIVEHRSEHGAYKDIKSLIKVPRMGAKSFEQCAGFLRIRNGKNPLDNTGVHPERYELVKKMAADFKLNTSEIISNKQILQSIHLQNYVNAEVGLPTLKDILVELSKPGFDIRGKAQSFEFTEGIESIDDLRTGMKVKGIINNITKFGAFVDIGIKEAGLIHISQMADRFIKDPMEVVQLNQMVLATVLEVDKSRKRVSLSLKQ